MFLDGSVYIAELLTTTLKGDKNVENKIMCIWGMAVLMTEEILHKADTASGLVKVGCDALVVYVYN